MNARWGLWPRISWNPPDFTLKSGGFHLWNPAEFTQISSLKSTQNYKSKCFSKNSSVWWMQGGGYDQGFHEIHQISPWNLVDFTCEIQQSSPRFHLWNPPKIIKASVSAKTLQFDECKVGAMTKDFMKSAWNLPDFTWNLPDFMKSTRFHMKCTGFHVKSKDLLQGIVTLCLLFFPRTLQPIFFTHEQVCTWRLQTSQIWLGLWTLRDSSSHHFLWIFILLDDRSKPHTCMFHEIHIKSWFNVDSSQKSMDIKIWIHGFPSQNMWISSESTDFNEIHSHFLDLYRETSNNERPLA